MGSAFTCCAPRGVVAPSPISGRASSTGIKSQPSSRRNSAVRSLAAASVVVDSSGKPIEPKKKSLFVRSTSNRGRMAPLALAFPKIKRSFQAVQTAFNQYCKRKGNDKKQLSVDKLGATLNAICSHKQFSDQEVLELFHLADLEGSRSISFREFLIAVGCGYFLKVNVAENKQYTEIQNGFRVVEKAFNDMDTDKSGSVDAKEMKLALFSMGDGAASNSDGASERSYDILEERFAELDFDGDGTIKFPEFMFGFFSWVGMDEDEASAAPKTDTPKPALATDLNSAKQKLQTL